MSFSLRLRTKPPSPRALLSSHFGRDELTKLVVTTRTFASRVRPDLQLALDEIVETFGQLNHFSGVRSDHQFMGLEFTTLNGEGHYEAAVAPSEYEQIDIGEDEPVSCLKVGFWLLHREGEPFALLMSPAGSRMSESGAVKFFVACRNNPQGDAIAADFFRKLEESVARSRSYRGKVLSLEHGAHSYSGHEAGILVHRLTPVNREDLILPPATIDLLERNVIGFCRRRDQLSRHGQSVRKGLLFYGPPGTGKTFTVRYLAGALPDHTTFLVTAEQVGLLPEYMILARLLQPSIVVIEDADLIARARTSMQNTCEEVMLNKLLNEMDGLREDAKILFILTTNRPETLEAALASRPGRIDQAIEFPAPNAENRAKLVSVYGKGTLVSPEIVQTIVNRTEGVSASFIKELMRRSIQFWIERDSPETGIGIVDVNEALEEMLFKGGSLNRVLLGGAENPSP